MQTDNQTESNEMDNFDLNELMNLAEAYVGQVIDAIYRWLMDRDFALEDSEMVMMLVALTNVLGHDNRGERPLGNLIDDSILETRSTRLPKQSRTRVTP